MHISKSKKEEIIMVKEVVLMPDYHCWPLWYGDGFEEVGDIEPDELPLSPETNDQLLRWANAYDRTLNFADPKDESYYFSEQELGEFEHEGISLWQKLQEELGSDYKVTYYSQKLHKSVNEPKELNSQ